MRLSAVIAAIALTRRLLFMDSNRVDKIRDVNVEMVGTSSLLHSRTRLVVEPALFSFSFV